MSEESEEPKKEGCVCGHINQEGGVAWVTELGIHTVLIHRGHCDNKKCKCCNPSNKGIISLFVLMGITMLLYMYKALFV